MGGLDPDVEESQIPGAGLDVAMAEAQDSDEEMDEEEDEDEAEESEWDSEDESEHGMNTLGKLQGCGRRTDRWCEDGKEG